MIVPFVLSLFPAGPMSGGRSSGWASRLMFNSHHVPEALTLGGGGFYGSAQPMLWPDGSGSSFKTFGEGSNSDRWVPPLYRVNRLDEMLRRLPYQCTGYTTGQ